MVVEPGCHHVLWDRWYKRQVWYRSVVVCYVFIKCSLLQQRIDKRILERLRKFTCREWFVYDLHDYECQDSLAGCHQPSWKRVQCAPVPWGGYDALYLLLCIWVQDVHWSPHKGAWLGATAYPVSSVVVDALMATILLMKNSLKLSSKISNSWGQYWQRLLTPLSTVPAGGQPL